MSAGNRLFGPIWNPAIKLYPVTTVLAVLLLTGCGLPLPESYGVYAREGRTLKQLREGTPIRLEKGTEFIVFDKIVGSGLLGSGAADLKDVFSVQQAAFVRYDIERIKNLQSGAITEVHITPSGQWLTLDQKVDVTFGPIKEQGEMLLIRPSVQLSNGLYAFRINSSSYSFSVGFDPEHASEDAANRCQDMHINARPKSSTFSWADWLSATQNTGESAHGNWLESTGHLDCSVLDNEAKSWKEAASEGLSSGKLREAVAPARLFAAYDPQGGRAVVDQLFDRLQQKTHQAFDKEQWGEAAELASLGLALKEGDAELMRISSTANQRRAELEATEAAAAAARHAARVKDSQTATKTLGKFTVISEKISRNHGLVPNARHPIEITDVSIRGLAYLQDAGWITSTNKLEDEYWFCWIKAEDVGPGKSYQGQPIVFLSFRNGWGWGAVFTTEEERSRFIDVLNAAKSAWYSRYGDLVVNGQCPSAN